MSFIYKCARCGETFESDRDDEEARAEFKSKYGIDPPTVLTEVVCDDCHVRRET